MAVAAVVACAMVVALVTIGVAGEKAAAKPDFKKMDADNDSKVTEAEFSAYVIACPELGLTKTVFTEWDKDKDGVVTVQEFEIVQPMEKAGCATTISEKVKEAAKKACGAKEKPAME